MANLSPFRGERERARFIAAYDSVMQGWPVPFEERDVETAFGHTHVVVSGDPSAPPLVFLHGASATSAMWRLIIAPLSDRYRCYCVDTITDANKSVATRRIYGAGGYVDWLRQVFAALDIPRARVTGLSYGGWLAAQLGLRAPECVSHLVLLAPGGTLAPFSSQFLAKTMTLMLRPSPSRLPGYLQWMSSTPDAPDDPGVDLIALSILTTRPRRRVIVPTVLSNDDLRRITMPVTVLIGEHEVIYRGGPKAALARAQKFIPKVRTQLMAGANHMLTLDCPDALVTEMSGALA